MIQHVALELRPDDGEACVRFWSLLGFSPVAVPPSLGDRALWLQSGATQVHLLYADEPVIAAEGHVAVVAEHYHATLDALRQAGLEPQPRTRHWGAERCFVRCPAGHRVEVMAFAPG